MKKMNVLGLFLSFMPLIGFLPIDFLFLENMVKWLERLPFSWTFIPYLIFSAWRLVTYRHQKVILGFLWRFLAIEFIVILAGGFGFIFLPVLEIHCQNRIIELEVEQDGVDGGVPSFDNIFNRLLGKDQSEVQYIPGKYSQQGIVLSFFPPIAMILIVLFGMTVPSGLVAFPLLFFLYLPSFIIYNRYADRRFQYYRHSSDQVEIFPRVIEVLWLVLGFFLPFLYPILEIVCYIKIKRMERY